MSRKIILDTDPITGRVTTFHANTDGTYGVSEVFDVGTTFDVNRREYNDAPDHWRGRENHHIASIPLPLYFELKKKGIVRDRKAFLKWLSDPDNRHFRTKPGRII